MKIDFNVSVESRNDFREDEDKLTGAGVAALADGGNGAGGRWIPFKCVTGHRYEEEDVGRRREVDSFQVRDRFRYEEEDLICLLGRTGAKIYGRNRHFSSSYKVFRKRKKKTCRFGSWTLGKAV